METRERLVVEIDRGSEPISGVVRSPDEREERARGFRGYIELIAALEQGKAPERSPEGSPQNLSRGGQGERRGMR